ncbi:unnamed protein product [Camellia sinensis]
MLLFGIIGVTDKCLEALSRFCSNTLTTLDVNGCIGIKVHDLVFSELQRAKRALGDTIARVMATVTRSMHNNGNYCNTVNLEDAALYKGRLERFFMDLRADLQSPMLPIIQVALASGQGPYIEKVREAQLGIHLAHVKCVDARGLQLEPDHLHLAHFFFF